MFGHMTEYFRRFNIKCNTVLHVGAHYGEEDELYTEFGVEPIYVEASPVVFQKLKKKKPHRKMHNIAISNKPGKDKFFIANNAGFSNSLLELDQHKIIYPDCEYICDIEVDCTTIDLLVEENHYNIDVICLDIQGAELMALEGATKTLKNVNIIYIEVALVSLYKNSPILPDLDKFLKKFNFKRVLTTLEENEWGDALYIKRDFLKKVRNELSFDPDPNKIIQLSSLGTDGGRFGNQLFQYAIGKGYCKTYGYTLEIPENWIGRELFKNIDDNIIKEELPSYEANQPPCGLYDVDFKSQYWFNQSAVSLFTRQQSKYWFEFKDKYKIKSDKTKKIVAHLRRGDFSQCIDKFTIITKNCYKKAIKKFGYNFDDIYFVQGNFYTPKHKKWVMRDPYYFLEDFQTIQNANVIFRGNSTFSWWAATLSDAKVFSPVVGRKTGWQDDIKFVEGNHPPTVYKDFYEQFISDMYLLST